MNANARVKSSLQSLNRWIAGSLGAVLFLLSSFLAYRSLAEGHTDSVAVLSGIALVGLFLVVGSIRDGLHQRMLGLAITGTFTVMSVFQYLIAGDEGFLLIAAASAIYPAIVGGKRVADALGRS